MDSIIDDKVKLWLTGNYDQSAKDEINRLLLENPTEIRDAFYQNLAFGTGGLRGIMGVGTNRMNKYTVGLATQGFANYLKAQFPDEKIKVVVAYDSRHNSRFFAEITANIFSANHIQCYLFPELRPTPELSFAVRHLKCHAGVMITASHNPKEYNGYKAYWQDGGQLVPPHDHGVINAVNSITSISDVLWDQKSNFVKMIGKEVDEAYLEQLCALSLNPEYITKRRRFKIVYTPLHGTGITLIPEALKRYGFHDVITVDEQAEPDGDFPTVKSPNPEEKEALKFAIKKAKEVKADIVLATDPDADRVAMAIKKPVGNYHLLNGNQAATLLINYLLKEMQSQKRLSEEHYIVKTIVTTDLLSNIALDYNIACYDVLTGFKYIAEIIREKEKTGIFVGGGEESFGYLIGDFVRDKDAVSACCILAELAVHALVEKRSAYLELKNIYKKYGYYKEELLSVTKKGQDGVEQINQMMLNYRNNPPKFINESQVVMIKDYLKQTSYHCKAETMSPISLPISDVLQLFTANNSKITMRPSGTEP